MLFDEPDALEQYILKHKDKWVQIKLNLFSDDYFFKTTVKI